MSLEHPSEKLPESPEEAARRAAEESNTFGDFRANLEHERRDLDIEEDADTRDELSRATRRFDRETTGHTGAQLTDDMEKYDRPGVAPHVAREDVEEVATEDGEFHVAEAADRAELRSKQTHVERLVDPKTGRIYTPEELEDGMIASEMNEEYRSEGVYEEDESYEARTGAKFVESYKGVDAFRDFIEGGSAVEKQVELVKESKTDTSDTEKLEKLADRAGFDKRERKEFLAEFASEDEDDPMAEVDPLEEDDDQFIV